MKAKSKIQNWYKEVALNDITVVYENLEENFKIEQFEAKLDIDSLIKDIKR